ncbi:MarR family winged helix-turn-helix transcriptional regulator [Kitasatospora aureofaciens]|uniref:MarR family winged helix-turn-helix transcriptional regulator n=1 Tax=Kitasatospora aureofaciens TaxID=1894 RepID=UPI001C438439|nr:MarR family transcriptional regulator [Kitasatospora aureofaciens]MBV6698009.1 MarR family transcriptional regulator [Kitasatospora aureofaciens]
MAELDSPAEAGLVAQWRELLNRHAETSCALDRELGEKHGLGMSEFEVLERLVEGCIVDRSHRLRVQELADVVHLSQSALSRLIGRLEKGGLVAREMCVDDRRGIQIVLTDAGRERYQQARPLHREVLARTLGGGPVDPCTVRN